MAGGRFAKQAIYSSAKYWNTPTAGDTTIGGTLTGAPSQFAGSQGQQTLAGDRTVFSPSDALVYSNNTVGNLYTGTYRYVITANSTSAPTRGHGAFWDTSVVDANYQVTSDEPANLGVSLYAGVFINNVAKLSAWWIQESGKCSLKMRTTLSGTAAIAAGIYLAGGGNNANAADVGAFDVLAGLSGTAPFNAANAYASVDAMFVKFVGVAETLPSNNNISLVDVPFSRGGFRW